MTRACFRARPPSWRIQTHSCAHSSQSSRSQSCSSWSRCPDTYSHYRHGHCRGFVSCPGDERSETHACRWNSERGAHVDTASRRQSRERTINTLRRTNTRNGWEDLRLQKLRIRFLGSPVMRKFVLYDNARTSESSGGASQQSLRRLCLSSGACQCPGRLPSGGARSY